MSKKKQGVDFYVASSRAENSSRIGYGFTKVTAKEHKLSSKAYRLDSSTPSLELADVLCVQKALNSLKSSANVTFFTTSSFIANAIAQPETIPDIIKKVQKNKPLRAAWEKTEKLLRLQNEVNAVLIHETDQIPFQEATRQAELGSTLSYKKSGQDTRHYKKHTKNDIENDISNELDMP